MSNENKQNDERAECAHDYVRTDGVCTECGGSATITCSSKDCPQAAQNGERAASVTAGMTLAERIAHVGGRENAAGYIEFGSVMAVDALIQHALRDAARANQQATTGDEQFEAIDVENHRLRRAMQKVMARLTDLLDEDQFANIESIVAEVGIKPPVDQLDEQAVMTIALREARDALESIRRYGLDTLSGRTDGPDDREWQRAGVNEMTKRARLALDQIDAANPSAVAGSAVQAPITDEQRQALQWAADRAHVESLGKSIGGVDGRRWRILLDLIRNSAAAPTAPSLPQESAGHAPKGWKLVPVEPTQEMLQKIAMCRDVLSVDSLSTWKAAIDAAPDAPETEHFLRPACRPPEGWKLVPIEPDKRMRAAAFNTLEIPAGYCGFETGTDARDSVYAAMIDAAPTAPSLATDAGAVLTHRQVRVINQAINYFDSTVHPVPDGIVNDLRALLAAHPAEQRTDHRHVGDSNFEEWYQEYATRLTGNPKQTARDAYAAGMGDTTGQRMSDATIRGLEK